MRCREPPARFPQQAGSSIWIYGDEIPQKLVSSRGVTLVKATLVFDQKFRCAKRSKFFEDVIRPRLASYVLISLAKPTC